MPNAKVETAVMSPHGLTDNVAPSLITLREGVGYLNEVGFEKKSKK